MVVRIKTTVIEIHTSLLKSLTTTRDNPRVSKYKRNLSISCLGHKISQREVNLIILSWKIVHFYTSYSRRLRQSKKTFRRGLGDSKLNTPWSQISRSCHLLNSQKLFQVYFENYNYATINIQCNCRETEEIFLITGFWAAPSRGEKGRGCMFKRKDK